MGDEIDEKNNNTTGEMECEKLYQVQNRYPHKTALKRPNVLEFQLNLSSCFFSPNQTFAATFFLCFFIFSCAFVHKKNVVDFPSVFFIS